MISLLAHAPTLTSRCGIAIVPGPEITRSIGRRRRCMRVPSSARVSSFCIFFFSHGIFVDYYFRWDSSPATTLYFPYSPISSLSVEFIRSLTESTETFQRELCAFRSHGNKKKNVSQSIVPTCWILNGVSFNLFTAIRANSRRGNHI